MGDSFTNFLLVALISLVGGIGKIFYDKLTEVSKSIQQIIIDDVGNKKDIEGIQDNLEDHEQRITQLEKK